MILKVYSIYYLVHYRESLLTFGVGHCFLQYSQSHMHRTLKLLLGTLLEVSPYQYSNSFDIFNTSSSLGG